jgi:hypothetical protein
LSLVGIIVLLGTRPLNTTLPDIVPPLETDVSL